ncbi:hypothetical protein KFL_004530060 [Klebsormidium nitens]|uniref:Uncharacterized protein n=1 Tax=Klebsormidium nitens TaxID=105231 RepID=A0A1Y1IFA2_KLENI|nr:hypothetical protein KFL_004530060 [Klebsormidium nitens]|eukprot:GAQ88702.1 hypothetical protein KFL_004530060 [Klebsormidium nitens]
MAHVSKGDHAGDLGNALRYFSWALRRVSKLREAHDSDEIASLMADVAQVYGWVRVLAATHTVAASETRTKFVDKVQDLYNLGYCAEEIYGDSPLGDSMHTGDNLVRRATKLAEVWRSFERIARELHTACNALADFDRPAHDAFVDIAFLPLHYGQPFPAFVTALADEAARGLEIRFCFGEASLTLLPFGKPEQASEEGHTLIKGGVLAELTAEGFPDFEGKATMAIMYKGRELFPVETTEVRIQTTPKATYVHGAIDSDIHVPVVNVVYKEGTIRYGFCSTGHCKDLSSWI